MPDSLSPPISPAPRRVANWSFKVAQTIIVERPPAVVFAYRCALAKTPEWRRDVVSACVAPSVNFGVGTRCTELRKGAGESTEDWELEVTGYEPGALLGIISRCRNWEVAERHQFASHGPATRYTVSAEVTGSSLPSAAFQKALVQSLLQLKWVLERVPPVFTS